MRFLFLGLSGYEYPHVRVRCYKFAGELQKHGIDAEVLSLRDHLAPQIPEAWMYALSDRDRIKLALRTLPRLLFRKNTVLVLQKLHYHTAAAHWLIRYLKRPFILDYDDYEVGTDHHGNPMFAGFRRPYVNRLFYGNSRDADVTEYAARNAAACICASHSLMDFLRQYSSRVFYIPTGVDAEMFRPDTGVQPPANTFRFLWTGVVWGETIAENLRFVIDALETVRGTVPCASLEIVGGGDFLVQVMEYARSKLPESAVNLHSWVAPDQMPAVLNSMHAGLLPLITDTEWTRSKSPTKLFEYLACGLPVVASPTGEVNYVMEHGKSGFFAENLETFTDAMIQLATSPDVRESMSRAARRTVEAQFSQEILGRRYAGILRDELRLC